MSDRSRPAIPVQAGSHASVPVWLQELGWAERFELLERIGTGGMGQVWRARERNTDRIVALKVLDPGRSGDEHLLARLDIEAATLMKLREAGAHEHVVPLLDFKINDEQACLVMEFIPGLNLRKWCGTHQLGLQERVRFIAQVARAAGWFHRLGVVHRDFKPANILVSAVSHQPVIVDFSIAKVDDNLPLTLTSEALGTVPYMAPEQIDRQRGPITPATDVYALGATLYELLTEVPPHPGSFTVIVQRHSDEVRPARPSALNPAISRDLECILLKALSHRAADRYGDGCELADDLEHFLAGDPVRARPLSPVTRVIRRARRNPALTTALAACLVTGVFALWNVRNQAEQREEFALEAEIAAFMQRPTWSLAELDRAEATLARLRDLDVVRSEVMRLRLSDDVVHDIEKRIEQTHLRAEDYEWLHASVSWLKARVPQEAKRFAGLISDREGRWETRMVVKAPFEDLAGAFKRSHIRVEKDLLYPEYDGPTAMGDLITVTDEVSVPSEASFTFVADASTFHSVTAVHSHESSRLSVALYKVRHLSSSILRQLPEADPDLESYVLLLSHHQHPQLLKHIPDIHLLDQPFRLTLRVEREWAEADINGHSRLHIDSLFGLSSRQSSNYWRLTWPQDVGLKEFTLLTRRSDTQSPLEQADLMAMEGRWPEAIRLYEQLRGHPEFGTEADFKRAECLLRQKNWNEAFSIMETLANGPASRWAERSLVELWYRKTVLRSEDAGRYLARLDQSMSPVVVSQINPWRVNDIVGDFAPDGMSIALPQVDVSRIRDGLKAFDLLQMPAVQKANRFALAHHAARLDQEAESLFSSALRDPKVSANNQKNLLASINCLDQRCRLKPSENDVEFTRQLAAWKKVISHDPSIQTIVCMETARRAARAMQMTDALAATQQWRTHEKSMDNRVHTSAWLLEGMLHRISGSENEAQSAWMKGLEVAATVTQRHPLHLCDLVMLHSLTRTWNLHSTGDVLSFLLARHLKGDERTSFQAEINRTFLSDPAWLTTLNAVLADERGRQFAEDYVLCREPPRELVQRFYRLLFEHYFVSTAFPRGGPEDVIRVRGIVDSFVNEMSMNPRADVADLHAYLRAWSDPGRVGALKTQKYPYSPALVTDLKWLLEVKLGRAEKDMPVKSGGS